MIVKEEMQKLGAQKVIDILEGLGRLDNIYMYFTGIYEKPITTGQYEDVMHAFFAKAGCTMLMRVLTDAFVAPTGSLIMDDLLELELRKRVTETKDLQN